MSLPGSDNKLNFFCLLNSDISVGITGSAPPNVFMKITDGSSDKDGASLGTAAIGDTARLHIWTDDVYDGMQHTDRNNWSN